MAIAMLDEDLRDCDQGSGFGDGQVPRSSTAPESCRCQMTWMDAAVPTWDWSREGLCEGVPHILQISQTQLSINLMAVKKLPHVRDMRHSLTVAFANKQILNDSINSGCSGMLATDCWCEGFFLKYLNGNENKMSSLAWCCRQWRFTS